MEDKEAESEGRKIYRAKSFARSVMTCPNCHLTLSEAVDHCPRCQYTGQTSMLRFPFPAPSLSRFIDPKSHLSEVDRERMSRSLNALNKKFPQPRLCFCIIDLAEGVDLREFGFWLMNTSPVDSPEEAEIRPWTILIVIDDVNGNVSVTPGYSIEPFLDDEAWRSLILKERQHFFARDYITGSLKLIEGAEKILHEGAARTERRMGKDKTGGKGKRRKVRKRRVKE